MRYINFIISFILCSVGGFTTTYSYANIFFTSNQSINSNIIERNLSNEKELLSLGQEPKDRSIDVPTQIIRISQTIDNQSLSCKDVNKLIDQILVNKITKDKFYYTTYISCTYDPETKFAINFTIYSYFDPLNDEAVAYLKNYLDEYNGREFLGHPFTIEPAKAVIVSMNFSVGIKKNPKTPPFVQYKDDRSNYYFANNYELHTQLIADIKQRFFSDEAGKILPFLDQWLFNHAGTLYKNILKESNYTLLQPEKIFLMEQGETLFVSPIKYYYANDCAKYPQHYCLHRES